MFTLNDNNCDVLHVVDLILPKSSRNKPYICDIGHIGALANHSGHTQKTLKETIDFFNDPHCKAVLFRSHAARHNAVQLIGPESVCVSKFKVCYPSIEPLSREISDILKEKDREFFEQPIKLLFVGTDCWRKGISEVIDAFNVLEDRLRVELTIVSNDAEDIRKAISSRIERRARDRVRVYPATYSLKELQRKFYATHHLFVMPSHHEIFGMVFIEAMAMGMPVIALDQFSSKEIIQDSVNGVLLPSEKTQPLDMLNPGRTDLAPELYKVSDKTTVGKLVEAITELDSNREMLAEMSCNAQKVSNSQSKFALSRRNRMLKDLYEKATR